MSYARSRRRTYCGRTTASPIRAIPKPCCSAGSTASTASAELPFRRTATITANTASSSIKPAQETTMQTVRTMIAGRRAVAAIAVRAAVAAGCALLLCGCNTDHRVAGGPDVSNDYRLRHPITLQEAARTIELFIGSNRGELTPTQRAQVLS